MNANQSPEGFFVYANSYKLAAESLMDQDKSQLLVPTLYLFTHSLELALKSFLLSKGVASGILAKKPYRHDVAYCLSQAEQHSLFGSTYITDSQRRAVASVSAMFDKRELSYFYEKPAVFPQIEEIQLALRAVLSAVFDRISEPYFREMEIIGNE